MPGRLEFTSVDFVPDLSFSYLVSGYTHSAVGNATKHTTHGRTIRAYQPASYMHVQGVDTWLGTVFLCWRLCNFVADMRWHRTTRIYPDKWQTVCLTNVGFEKRIIFQTVDPNLMHAYTQTIRWIILYPCYVPHTLLNDIQETSYKTVRFCNGSGVQIPKKDTMNLWNETGGSTYIQKPQGLFLVQTYLICAYSYRRFHFKNRFSKIVYYIMLFRHDIVYVSPVLHS